MKLTPIKEFTKFGTRERSFTIFNDVELELLRQAIISDFVNGLEPVGWTNKLQISYLDDGDSCIVYSDQSECPIPLFDLSEWINK